MKILFCQPPVEDFYTTPDRHYPLGLLSLAGYVNDLPVQCKIIDFLHTGERYTLPIPENFKPVRHYLPYDTSPVKIFHHYYHFGRSWETIASIFRDENPDVIAVSSLFYTYMHDVVRTVRIARKACPRSVIIVGGQNVRDGLSRYNDDLPADYLIQGEGEEPFRAIIKKLLGKNKNLIHIPGIMIKEQGVFTASSGSLPCTPMEFIEPDHSLVKSGDYTIGGLPAAMIQTSRGCSFGCGFCTIERTFGRRIRYRPVSNILNEMGKLYRKGIKVIDFEDDNLTADRKFALELFSSIRERFGNTFRLYAMNGLSSWMLDEEMLRLMNDAGFVMVNLSVGTLSEKSLKKSHRIDSRGDFERVVNIAAALGMKVMGYFIAGLPGESIEENLDTLAFLSRLPVVAGISPFYYVPGQNMDIPNIPADPRNARLSRFYPADDFWTEKDLITLFRLTRWVNYVKRKMNHAGIRSCPVEELNHSFPHDPIITELISHSRLAGYTDRKKKDVYFHEISDSTVTKFMKIVRTIVSDHSPES
jgi:radical SAM superfamily enzyme YgiQ (UPF0313 family)